MKYGSENNSSNITTRQTFPVIIDNNKFIYFLLGAVILFVFIARLHLLSIPLERDEGEYAYMGRLILNGHPPYTLAYNMKLPGVYYMYALIMAVFGQSVAGIHLGLAFVSIISMLLVFLISKQFVSKAGAVIASSIFGIMGTSFTLLGQAGHATHFVTLFALFGIYTTLGIYSKNKRSSVNFLLVGIFYSLSFICKQSGLFFLLFGITLVVIKGYSIESRNSILKQCFVLLLGFILPLIILLSYFYFFADFHKFWFWTVQYLSEYGTQVPYSEIPLRFREAIVFITQNYTSEGYILLWLLALIALPFVFINKTSVKNKIIISSFLFFSFLTTVPGFHFRNHYFICLLPATGILIAVLFDTVTYYFINISKKPTSAYLSFILFILFIGTGVRANVEYLFKENTNFSSKRVYGLNAFVESVDIAEYLKQHTAKDDKIAVFGSEPQLYFYADRYSATGYIYTYNLVETHAYALRMQQEMQKEIEENKPAYFVYVNVKYSWLPASGSETYIFKWANNYVAANYTYVGIIDVLLNQSSRLITGEALKNYTPKSNEFISIYKRNN